MNIWQRFLSRLTGTNTGAQIVRALTSFFSKDIYSNDTVNAAIWTIATEMKKLTLAHVHTTDGNYGGSVDSKSSQARVLVNPNALMTQSDLIEKVIWQLFFNSNAYIYPAYDLYRDGYGNTVRKYTALYPLNPAQPPTFLYDAINGTFAVQMNLGGDMFTLPYADLIHIRLKYSLNDILGGNAMGHMETASLKALLHTSADTMTGLAKSALTAGAINGVVYANGLLGKDKMKGEIEKFNQQLNDPAFSGLLQLDQGSSAQQWSRAAKMVDVDTLKYLDEKILRWFGVSLPIISGDYTPAQFEAFHNSVLEPLIVSFSQAFTRVLFTPREQSFGNRITLQSNELLFMTRSEINTLVATAAPMGIFYDNEIRGFYGLPPIPELEGVRHQSLNYIDTKLAPFYQSGAQGQGESNG